MKPTPTDQPLSPASTGNASNPSPEAPQQHPDQLLNKKADTYLREAGNIEDMPDVNDEEKE